jgi:hypothetical protein
MCSQFASDLVADVELLVEDDAIVTMAILNDVFDFLRKSVVCSRNFYEEVFLHVFALTHYTKLGKRPPNVLFLNQRFPGILH